MPALDVALRSEMKKVVHDMLADELKGLRTQCRDLQREIASLSRRTRDLEQRMAFSTSKLAAGRSKLSARDVEEIRRLKPTSKMVKELRERLDVSQRELGLLLGVSAQAVYLWERRNGALNLRSKAIRALWEASKLTPAKARHQLDSAVNSDGKKAREES